MKIWGLGIGDWAQSPIPNPQSPIPNPQFSYFILLILEKYKFNKYLFFNIYYLLNKSLKKYIK